MHIRIVVYMWDSRRCLECELWASRILGCNGGWLQWRGPGVRCGHILGGSVVVWTSGERIGAGACIQLLDIN